MALEPIPEEDRKTEGVLSKEFDEVKPRLLGALLDGVSTALRREPSIKLKKLPRMADFARFAAAAMPSFGWRTKRQGREL